MILPVETTRRKYDACTTTSRGAKEPIERLSQLTHKKEKHQCKRFSITIWQLDKWLATKNRNDMVGSLCGRGYMTIENNSTKEFAREPIS